LHMLRRPAQGLAHLSVEVIARCGRRTLRHRTARFSNAGRPRPSTTGGSRRSSRPTRRIGRLVARLESHGTHRGNAHPFERLGSFSEGKRMNTSPVIRGSLPFRRRASAQAHDATPATETTKASSPRILRIARLMALARHIDDLVRSGALSSYAAAARL